MADSGSYLSKNDTLVSIKNRRSVRIFSDDAVSDGDLQTILHAAKLSTAPKKRPLTVTAKYL